MPSFFQKKKKRKGIQNKFSFEEFLDYFHIFFLKEFVTNQ